MLIVMVILLFGSCFLFDFLPNAKNSSKKEKIVYLSVFAVSLLITVLYALDVQVPSISSLIMPIIDAIFGKRGG